MDTSTVLPGWFRVAALRLCNRLFSDDRRIAMSAEQQTSHELEKAPLSMGKYLRDIPGRDVDILDFGCGWGGETLWLAQHVKSVIGIDVDQDAVNQAEAARDRRGLSNCRFACGGDGLLPVEDESVDAVFSTDTFEHVMDLDLAFREIFRVLRPGGLLRTTFGPLFYSPYGYHLQWACQVPYAHLLFGLRPVLALRNEVAHHAFAAASWEDTGLNRKRFQHFYRAASEAGFEMDRFERIPVKGLRSLMVFPIVRDLLTFGVDCTIRKPCR